jgi:hypothetical protein
MGSSASSSSSITGSYYYLVFVFLFLFFVFVFAWVCILGGQARVYWRTGLRGRYFIINSIIIRWTGLDFGNFDRAARDWTNWTTAAYIACGYALEKRWHDGTNLHRWSGQD